MRTRSVILSSLIVQMKSTFSRPMFKVTLFIYPLARTVILGEMYRNASDANFMSFVILGAGLMSLWECIVFSSASDIMREKWSNTLSRIFISPSSFQSILLGKIIGNTILSLGSLVLSVLFTMILYRRPFVLASPLLFILSLLLAILCFLSVSIFAAYVLILSRRSYVYMNCLDIPVQLICGFAFPISMIPLWGRWISWLLPPTWGVNLMRLCVNGGGADREYLTTLGFLLLTTAVYAVGSRLLYNAFENRIRIKATMEVV